MSEVNLNELRRAMLRGGVAPRYVRRTVAELQQHFQDLEQQALASGADQDEARRQARRRLGDENTLLDSILSRHELKSWSARYPRSIYLLSPIAALILVMALSIAGAGALAGTGLLSVQGGDSGAAWIRSAILLLFGFNEYLLTPMLAVLYYLIARSRMTSMTWPAAGIILLAFIGSGWEITVDMPSAVSDTGALHLTWGYAFLGIPVPEGHTVGAVVRLLLTLGLTATANVVYRMSTRQPAA